MDFRLLESPADWDAPAFRETWEALTVPGSPNVLYSSPLWFDHLRGIRGHDRLAVMIRRNAAGVTAIAPLARRDATLAFTIGKRSLWRAQVPALEVLGGEPLGIGSAEEAAEFLTALLAASGGRHSLYFDSVETDTPVARAARSGALRRAAYAPGGERVFRLIGVPASLEDYEKALGSHGRNVLRSRLKKLEAEGPLELVRSERPEDVPLLLREATAISVNSWQHRLLGERVGESERHQEWYCSLARRGVLRSYVLRCGGRPCAFSIGYQYKGVFYLEETGYDAAFARLAAGSAVNYLMIRDLCQDRPPELINFGVGDAEYKQRFGNIERRDLTLILFGGGLRPSVLRASHSGFRAAVGTARRAWRSLSARK